MGDPSVRSRGSGRYRNQAAAGRAPRRPGDACVIWPHAATGDMEDFTGFTSRTGSTRLRPDRPLLDGDGLRGRALRNLTCVGADPSRAALLDNFCWASPEDPKQLGALVRAARAAATRRRASARRSSPARTASTISPRTRRARAADSRHAADLGAGAGARRAQGRDDGLQRSGQLALSDRPHQRRARRFALPRILGRTGGEPPKVLPPPRSTASSPCTPRSTADGPLGARSLDGGLAIAARRWASPESSAACSTSTRSARPAHLSNETLLFSESPSRILVEVTPENEGAFLRHFGKGAIRAGAPRRPDHREPDHQGRRPRRLSILEESLRELKDAWQRPCPDARMKKPRS